MSQKEFIVVITITFFVIMFWIISDIIHSKTALDIDPRAQSLTEPLNPTFDADTLKLIKDLPKLPESTRSAQTP